MRKTPIRLQDLRRKIYLKGKADRAQRFSVVPSVETGGLGPDSQGLKALPLG